VNITGKCLQLTRVKRWGVEEWLLSAVMALYNGKHISGGMSTTHGIANFLLSLAVKEFLKSDKIWQSYGQNLGASFFLEHGVVVGQQETAGLSKWRWDYMKGRCQVPCCLWSYWKLLTRNSGQEFLYANDLILMAESEEKLHQKIVKWKVGMKVKGLKMSTWKAQVICTSDRVEANGKWPEICEGTELAMAEWGVHWKRC